MNEKVKDLMRVAWYFSCSHIFSVLPDSLFFNIQAFVADIRKHHVFRWLDVNNPKRFNEKINYLKQHPLIKNGELLADKYRVRDYVKNKLHDIGGDKYLVPLLGVWTNVDDINIKDLPESFVLKSNHGSGWNIICKDKAELDWNYVKRKMRYWLNNSQYWVSREWQYKNCPHMILCEKFLEYEIIDYKFFCFDGVPRYIQVDQGRFSDHRRAFFSTEWNLEPFTTLYKRPDVIPERPAQLEEMLCVARRLSEGINFIRVDLYVNNGNVYFGEKTLHPGGGCDFFIPDVYDYKLGDLLRINSQ